MPRSEMKSITTPDGASSSVSHLLETPTSLPAPTPTGSPLSSLSVGQRVRAKFLGRTRWYSGEVRCVNADGTYAIDYEDGDSEEAVNPKHVKLDDKPVPLSKIKPSRGATSATDTATKPPQSQAQSEPETATKPPPSQDHLKPHLAETPQLEDQAEVATLPADPVPISLSKRQRTKSGSGKVDTETAASVHAAPQDSSDRQGEVCSTERLLQLLDEVSASEDAPSRAAVQSISQEVRVLHKQQLRELPSALLRTLLKALQPLVSPSSVGGENCEEETQGVVDNEHALEAALLAVSLVGVPGMARELLIEELLEAIIQLAKTQYAVLTALTPDGSIGEDKAATAGGKRSLGASGKSKKQSKESPAKGLLALLLERLPLLVKTGGLNDSLLLQLGQLGLNAAMSDWAHMSLQMGGVQVLAIHSPLFSRALMHTLTHSPRVRPHLLSLVHHSILSPIRPHPPQPSPTLLAVSSPHSIPFQLASSYPSPSHAPTHSSRPFLICHPFLPFPPLSMNAFGPFPPFLFAPNSSPASCYLSAPTGCSRCLLRIREPSQGAASGLARSTNVAAGGGDTGGASQLRTVQRYSHPDIYSTVRASDTECGQATSTA